MHYPGERGRYVCIHSFIYLFNTGLIYFHLIFKKNIIPLFSHSFFTCKTYSFIYHISVTCQVNIQTNKILHYHHCAFEFKLLMVHMLRLEGEEHHSNSRLISVYRQATETLSLYTIHCDLTCTVCSLFVLDLDTICYIYSL